MPRENTDVNQPQPPKPNDSDQAKADNQPTSKNEEANQPQQNVGTATPQQGDQINRRIQR